MKLFRTFLSLAVVLLVNSTNVVGKKNELCDSQTTQLSGSNNCIQFTVSSGTGCAWMCNYCANQLATNNYYFTDGVCTYQEGQGCVGNPIAGKTYSCCSV
jgi:hypothetical protein